LKKLLKVLGSFAIVLTPISSVVACGLGSGGEIEGITNKYDINQYGFPNYDNIMNFLKTNYPPDSEITFVAKSIKYSDKYKKISFEYSVDGVTFNNRFDLNYKINADNPEIAEVLKYAVDGVSNNTYKSYDELHGALDDFIAEKIQSMSEGGNTLSDFFKFIINNKISNYYVFSESEIYDAQSGLRISRYDSETLLINDTFTPVVSKITFFFNFLNLENTTGFTYTNDVIKTNRVNFNNWDQQKTRDDITKYFNGSDLGPAVIEIYVDFSFMVFKYLKTKTIIDDTEISNLNIRIWGSDDSDYCDNGEDWTAYYKTNLESTKEWNIKLFWTNNEERTDSLTFTLPTIELIETN
jgi:hypothetical protein